MRITEFNQKIAGFLGEDPSIFGASRPTDAEVSWSTETGDIQDPYAAVTISSP